MREHDGLPAISVLTRARECRRQLRAQAREMNSPVTVLIFMRSPVVRYSGT
jgi:hypothetical protein